MKELGLNLLRKHIKIEPECFYYYKVDFHRVSLPMHRMEAAVMELYGDGQACFSFPPWRPGSGIFL